MATSENHAGPGTLQRGKACLRCRKRKMRCDGVKPACHQCVRAKKADACEYDDGKGKTRTQILREHISRLEQRIRELEDPEYTSPSVTLHDPHAHQPSPTSSSSSAGSPSGISLASSYSLDIPSSPQTSWLSSNSRFSSPTVKSDSFLSDDLSPPVELSRLLLEIFIPHRHQCGLEVDVERLRESLTLPLQDQPHPALMNAIFMWGCFFSRPGPISQNESLYLSRALDGISDALHHPTKVIDIIQASCLLSLYFLSNGRLLEGTYHGSAAASLAVQWGLHRLSLDEANIVGWEPIVLFKLDQPKDATQEGERILTFWQTFDLDRCWSVALQRPISIQDEKNSPNSINLPWPQSIEEYASCQIDEPNGLHTIQSFIEGRGSTHLGGFSVRAQRVKASALLETANRLSSNWDYLMATSPTYQEDFQAVEQTILRFLSTLVPVHQLDGSIPDVKPTLLVAHTLAHAALIHLHYRFSQDDPTSLDKCLRAARACVAIIRHISENDYDFLDPIIGPCWMAAANSLGSELNSIDGSWALLNRVDIRNEIGLIHYALTKLGTRFPLLGFQAVEVQKLLSNGI
ncbi:hypothetical protein JAAARDRAFT_691687 [Jaapia argillacea MUCL 33604]|uniref:Zn(2)-C6 fungal-type domain-containing protein n=1 Tax=Jaapia argillacea MUCL 33604 TaxID=933084 RepID=A0A067PPI0_9AGAM|nr:hypothetical protein JAAARDRAFT_691687 [Jaapia argillacea MUCL 33604]